MWSKFTDTTTARRRSNNSDANADAAVAARRSIGDDEAKNEINLDTNTDLTEDLISCNSVDTSENLLFEPTDPSVFDNSNSGNLALDAPSTSLSASEDPTNAILSLPTDDPLDPLSLDPLAVVRDVRNSADPGIRRNADTGSASSVTKSAASLSSTSDQGLEEITQQMGQLWYPNTIQDMKQTFHRDKYGRLVPSSEQRKGSSSSNNKNNKRSSSPMDGNSSSHSEQSSSAQKGYAEWYDKVVNSVYAATVNLVGTVGTRGNRMGGTEDAYVLEDDTPFLRGNYGQRMDPKLQTSMILTRTIDKFWAKELYEMDAKERENINNEIHGIKSDKVVDETPESIETAIKNFRTYLETNLDQELDNRDSIVPAVTKDAYRRGKHELLSDYITSEAFLIKFLRICYYDFETAALRYFRYLDLLHLLFGDEALTRPLALKDLTKREVRYLKKGQMQLLPSRDRAGRRIFAFSGCDDWHFNIREKYRTNVYLIDVLSDDVTTQKLGAVTLNAPRVRYDLGDNPFGFEGMTLRMGKQELLGGKCTEAQFFRKINEAVPIRFSAMHYFGPATIIYDIGRAIILSLLGKDHRKIVRFHAGSQLECDYSLRSFGIPHEDITITEGNNIKTKHVQKFIQARKSIESFRERQREKQLRNEQKANDDTNEEEEEESPGIECPEVDCIVFGDKTMNGLPANVEFREILKTMERERGEQLQTSEASVLPIKQFIDSIIAKAQSPEHNLRFLIYDKKSNLFVDIRDRDDLCKRVSQALRDQRKRSRAEERAAAAETTRTTTTSPTRSNRSLSPPGEGGSDALEETGSSIMGLDAAKRLKRSYQSGNTSICSHSTSSGSSCFCMNPQA